MSDKEKNMHFWLTPKDQYDGYNREFKFDFDPCPYPKPEGFDSLKMEWGNSSYVNLLLDAGADVRSAGRTKWISGISGDPVKSPSPTTLFILKGQP